jgi:hypothetical protein
MEKRPQLSLGIFSEALLLNRIGRSALIAILFTFMSSLTGFAEEQPEKQNHKWLYGFRVGILAHDVAVWSRSSVEGGVDFNAEFIFEFPKYPLFSGVLRSNLGLSLNNQGDTSKVYTGLLWEYVWDSGIFLDLGVGLAVHNGELDHSADHKELGSRVLFRIPIEIGIYFKEHHGLSMMFDHVSNAYLAEPNEGLDTVGLRYTYRF